MSEPTDTTEEPTVVPPERAAPIIGVFVVIVAVSSLFDDTGLLRHSWWVPLVVGVVVVAVGLMARTVQRLVDHED